MSDADDTPDEILSGQRVQIISGTFEGFRAVVKSIDQENGKVFAEIPVFGKVHHVELGRGDVRPIK
ncbi:MAG TPA: KOW motif-containing protein [Pirellulales bacterium]|jgi:transcription antitermination factor NusG